MRRTHLSLVFVALLIWDVEWSPLAARDVNGVPLLGEVWVQDEAGAAPYREPLTEGLHELGYREGHNLIVLTRYAKGDRSKLPSLLDELIKMHVDVLFVSQAAVVAAKNATATIPIVSMMNDPVGSGLVGSLGNPGGNLTGISWQTNDTATKRLELVFELLPKLNSLAVLFDEGDRAARLEADAVSNIARKARVTVVSVPVRGATDLQLAFAAIGKAHPQALYLVASAITTNMRNQIANLALGVGVPVISEDRSLAEAGAVLTYGSRLTPVAKRAAVCVDKLLKGAKPQDVPIEQLTEFEQFVNLKSARAIGLAVPESILSRTDQVIH
jgi:putative ABC transport system substrate-binding protein